MEQLLTIQEAAALLRLKTSTLYAKVSDKSIPHIKLGTRVLFSPKALSDWVKNQEISHGNS